MVTESHRSIIMTTNTPLWKLVLTAILGCIGLIIDAFGELRDQQEQVREDMEVCRFHPHDPTFIVH